MDKNTTHDNPISSKFKAMNEIPKYYSIPLPILNTWKSAFRECAKLSSKIINNQNEEETNERLKTWTTVGHDRQYGEYALEGATAGMEFDPPRVRSPANKRF